MVSFVESVSLCVFGLSGMILQPGQPPRVLGGSRVAALSAAKLHLTVNTEHEQRRMVGGELLPHVW